MGDKINVHNILEDILSDSKIFGVNLYDAGIGEKIEGYFLEMISKKKWSRNYFK